MLNGRLHRVVLLAMALASLMLAQACAQQAEVTRVAEGLVVLYLFDEGEGTRVGDKSEVGEPLDLLVSDPEQVRWAEDGGLEIVGKNVALRTEGPAEKVIAALQASNELTIEGVVTPANTTQGGPTRIVSLSRDFGVRNFTLGQQNDKYILRLRTTTDPNGMPDLGVAEGVLETERQHVVVTYMMHDVRIYVNGELQAQHDRGGDFSAWDTTFRLLVGNEDSMDRQWQGKVELVAIYDRVLTAEQIQRNYQATAPEE